LKHCSGIPGHFVYAHGHVGQEQIALDVVQLPDFLPNLIKTTHTIQIRVVLLEGTSLNDRRWYLWVPGIATLLCVPFQFATYLPRNLSLVLPMFGAMTFMAAVFFGPSFAMTQAISPLRMRSVATSLLLLVQTLIGNGIGPWVAGYVSDYLKPSMGTNSLRYSLVIVGLVNVWAALHYLIGARSLRQDLEGTEQLAGSAGL